MTRPSVLLSIVGGEMVLLAVQNLQLSTGDALKWTGGLVSVYLVWLGSTNWQNRKLLTEISTLLKGEGGLVERVKATEHVVHEELPRLIDQRYSQAMDRVTGPIAEAEDRNTRRVERVEDRLSELEQHVATKRGSA